MSLLTAAGLKSVVSGALTRHICSIKTDREFWAQDQYLLATALCSTDAPLLAVWIIQQPWRGGATGWRRWDLNLKSSFGAHVTAGIPSDGATRDGLYIEVVSCAECGHTQVDKKSVVKNEVVINPRIRKDKNGSILWNPSTAVLLLKNRRNEWDQWTTGA